MSNNKIDGIQVIPGFNADFPQSRVVLRVSVDESLSVSEELLDGFYRKFSTRGAPEGLKEGELKEKATIVQHATDAVRTILTESKIPLLFDPIVEKRSGPYFVTMPSLEGAHQTIIKLIAATFKFFITQRSRCEIEEAIETYISELKTKHSPRGINTLALLEAADTLGIPFYRHFKNIYQFGQGRKLHFFDSSCSDNTSSLALRVSKNKMLSKTLLSNSGLPVARGWVVSDIEHAVRTAQKLGYPVVVKPSDQDRGKGVLSLIDDEQTLRSSYEQACVLSDAIMVEKFIPGNDYRIHTLNGKAYRIRKRTPGGVIGDGISTITELLGQLNRDPRRAHADERTDLVRIELDREAIHMLQRQGLTPDDTPEAARFVALRTTANVSTGGLTEAVPMDQVHPENLALAERAVSILNLDIAAVDFITPDIGRSWIEMGGAICEINGVPQFGASDAPRLIMREFFPEGGLIPTTLLIGELSTDTLLDISARLAERGLNLGYADNRNTLWVGDKRMAVSLPQSTYDLGKAFILQRDVDAILLKVDRELENKGFFTPKVKTLVINSASSDSVSKELAEELLKICEKIIIMSDSKSLPGLIDIPVQKITYVSKEKDIIPLIIANILA